MSKAFNFLRRRRQPSKVTHVVRVKEIRYSLSEAERNTIFGLMDAQDLTGSGYRWLRNAVANSPNVREAVEFCTDENFHTLAASIKAAFK